MLNNIVDNLEQCGQHNIVQCCFHQARTGCAFFAVYMLKIFGIDFNDQCNGTLNKLGHYVTLHISCHFVFIHSITKTRLNTCHVVSVC